MCQTLALALTSYLEKKLASILCLKSMSGQYFWLAQDSPLGHHYMLPKIILLCP